MSLESDFLGAIETHNSHELEHLLSVGVSAVRPINGITPLEQLTSGYLRSNQFTTCLRILMEAGATFDDRGLQAVLFDDADALRQLMTEPDWTNHRVSMRAAFTCCEGVTLLHLCAEFNSVQCATVLLNAGADVNATASIDEHGCGGQTPIFHAVNSIHNYSRPMLELLVERGAHLDHEVAALVWGRTMDWETVVVSTNPLSYAQCGLYRQFHRSERDTYSNLSYLYERRYGNILHTPNVPNKYLS